MAFQVAMRSAFAVAGSQSVICADWRDADVLPLAVAVADACLLALSRTLSRTLNPWLSVHVDAGAVQTGGPPC